jgi:tyrosine aminotransferase
MFLGNFPPPVSLINALNNALHRDKFPYNLSYGKFEARAAVAEYSKHQGLVTADDIILASGCSHAMEMCVLTLTAPGENVLIPKPCYNYKTWLDGMKVEAKAYNLSPDKGWDIDLKDMEKQIDEKTRCIIVNNPGNPCGNVFSKEHILDLLAVAERHKLPIVADEIYEHFVFPGIEYHSVSSLSKTVPILTCSGLSKRFLVPGIRMGWIVIHDRNDSFGDVKQGLRNVSARILGPNSTVQYALPEILQNTQQQFFVNKMMKIAVSICS